MVPSTTVTRRRALATGALAGLVLARPPLPAFAAPRARSFTLDAEVGPVLRARRRFDLVGAPGHPHGLQVRLRREGGRWSRWVPLANSHGDPVWAGGADELQLRGPRRRVRLHLVAVGAGAKARAARTARASARASQAGPPTIVPRSGWGGDQVKPRAAPSYGEVQLAFVHHTVTANDYTPEEAPAIVLGIAKYHRDTNGWNDIGYNFLVDRYGQIYEGRAGGIDQPVIGAQAQGYNGKSTGIAVIGTHGDVAATPEALEAVSRLLAWKLSLHGVPVGGQVVVESAGGDQNRYRAGTQVTFERVSGHRDGDSTSCPGNALYAQLPQIRARAAELAPTALASVVRLGLQRLEGAPSYGSDLEVAGTLVRPDGSPVTQQRVDIQKRGSKRWVTVGRATTDARGVWATRVAWRRAGRVRARAAVPGSPVAVTPTTMVGLTPVAELTAAAARVRAGSSVTLDARILPVTPAALLIEREVRGRFRRVGKQAVRPRRSRTRIRLPLRRPGLYRLTLRVEVDDVAVRSEPVVVRAVRRGRSLEPGGGAAPPGGESGAGSGGTSA